MDTTTNTERLTADMIRALRDDAGTAGDMELCAVCTRALTGDAAARATCARAFNNARGADDGDYIRVIA